MEKRIEINLQYEGKSDCHLAEYLVMPADNFVLTNLHIRFHENPTNIWSLIGLLGHRTTDGRTPT
jgi:hypothetical protein